MPSGSDPVTGQTNNLAVIKADAATSAIGGAMPSVYRSEAFTEDVARMLADEANPALLAEAYDLEDQGIQDV